MIEYYKATRKDPWVTSNSPSVFLFKVKEGYFCEYLSIQTGKSIIPSSNLTLEEAMFGNPDFLVCPLSQEEADTLIMLAELIK